MPKLTSRKILIGCLVIVLILIARPVGHITYTWFKDSPRTDSVKRGHTNDASHLNETAIDTIVKVAAEREAAIHQLAALIKTAITTGKKISIAGAQHSMGGHTI